MHLIEQYALSCGVKIDKPFVETCFFPVECQKYITLHASSGMQAKNYDYFNDVSDLISPFLKEKNINILQIGDQADRKIQNCIHYNGTTNLKQTFYLIKNSLLHFGNDSFSSHVASGFNKKIVCLYSVLFKECCGPYWGKAEDHVLLEPSRDGKKPSFSANESPKSVNEISAESIACGILDLLKIDHDLNKLSTIHTGLEYHVPSIYVIPNHVMPESFAPGQPVNIDGRECFDERNIAEWAHKRQCNIFLDKPMRINFLQMVKQNVNQINFFVSMDTDLNYIKTLHRLGFKMRLLSDDKDAISDIRIKFFDFEVFEHKKLTKKDLDNSELLCNNTRYNNSRKIVSNGKIYNSKAAWSHELEGEHNTVIDCDEFWEELSTLKLYNDNRISD